VAGNCECGNEPSGSIKCGDFLTSCKTVSFSRRTLLHGVSKQREDIRVRSNGKIVQAGKNVIIGRKVVPLSLFSPRNLTLTGLGGSNPGICHHISTGNQPFV
jgi:hypothetical protein